MWEMDLRPNSSTISRQRRGGCRCRLSSRLSSRVSSGPLYLNQSQGGMCICGTTKMVVCAPIKLFILYLEDSPIPLPDLFPNAYLISVSV